MPVLYNLPSFNLDGFKDTLADWNVVVGSANAEVGTIQQVISDRKLNSSLVLHLFDDRLIIVDQGIAVLKQQFRSSTSDKTQADILSDLVELLIKQLKRKPMKDVPACLIARPWFGGPSCDSDHLSSILKEKEELAESVVIEFFQNPDER